MSATQTQTKRNVFTPAPVQVMPILACLGYVEEVGENKVTSTQKYVMQNLKIKGVKGSRGSTLNLLYRPEWLKVGYDPSQIESDYDEDTAKGLLFIYRKMFGTSGKIGTLEGICGSVDAYEKFCGVLQALPEITEDSVKDAFHTFFVKDNPGILTCGYTLKQRRSKTDETDENGKNIYVLDEGYEIDSFFHPTDDAIKGVVKRANKSEGKFRVAFEV